MAKDQDSHCKETKICIMAIVGRYSKNCGTYYIHSTSYINPEYHKSMIKWTKEIKLCKVFIYYIEHVTYILT